MSPGETFLVAVDPGVQFVGNKLVKDENRIGIYLKMRELLKLLQKGKKGVKCELVRTNLI